MTANSHSACQKDSNEIKTLDFDIRVQPDDPNHAQPHLEYYAINFSPSEITHNIEQLILLPGKNYYLGTDSKESIERKHSCL